MLQELTTSIHLNPFEIAEERSIWNLPKLRKLKWWNFTNVKQKRDRINRFCNAFFKRKSFVIPRHRSLFRWICYAHSTGAWYVASLLYLSRTWVNVTDNCEVRRVYASASQIYCFHVDWSHFYSVPLDSSIILIWGSEDRRQDGGC